MNTDSKFYKSITLLALATGFLLLIPLVAMQFSDEVLWTLFDFVIASILLFSTGLAYLLVTQKLASRMGENFVYRVAVGFALFTGLFLIWSNLAVGIIGSEDQAINLLYFGVIIVGILGAFIVRFRPKGMVGIMFAMAFAQGLVTAIALLAEMYQPISSVLEILAVNGFFIMLFVVAALLFRHAALDKPSMNTEPES
jgi:hypothetical protein